MIHANHLQVHTHLARGDVNSARIASAEAKKYARIAVYIGTFFILFGVAGALFPIILSSVRFG